MDEWSSRQRAFWQRSWWRGLVFIVAAILLGLFTLGYVLQACSAMAQRPSFAAQMMEDLAPRLLQDGTERATVERAFGKAGPHPLFPGWDAAYNLGPKGLSFNPRNDWLLVRYAQDRVAVWIIETEPRR